MSAGLSSLKNIWSGGNQPFKASYGKLMMWIFLLSDAFTFATFLIGYAMIRILHPVFEGLRSTFTFSELYWPIPDKVFNAFPFFHGINMPLIFVSLMTFILILSSVTMYLAVIAGAEGKKEEVEKWMLWTIFGGLCFLSCQAWEWSHFIEGTDTGLLMSDGSTFFGANLIKNEYGPQSFASFFFFITGFHGFHVASGIIINMIIYYNTVMGVYEKIGHYEMVEKVGLYWHFVDLVWVFVFTSFYLI